MLYISFHHNKIIEFSKSETSPNEDETEAAAGRKFGVNGR